MIDDSGTHFGTDEEILSAYVLGRLGEAERERIDRHAASCASCAASLRREILVAAGVRKLGRETLKADLKKRIDARDAPAHWLRITAAAAALCVVAGLGTYYALLSRSENPAPGDAGTPPTAGTSGEIAQNERSAPPEGLARSGTADNVLPAPAAAPSPAYRHAESNQKALAQTLHAGRDNSLKEESVTGGISRTGAAVNAVRENAGFWSDGIVEEGEGLAGAAAAKKSAPEAEEKSLFFESDAARNVAAPGKDAPAPAQGVFLVRQQPSSALPPGREKSAGDRSRIPTRVEQKGERTTLTMYLDSLVDENEMKRARVDAMRDDSVIVTIGGKKILYHIPRGGETQGQQPQK